MKTDWPPDGDSRPLPRTSLEPICPAFAAVLRARRLERGWSLRQMARRTGLSRQAIAFVETEARIPGLDAQQRMARALGISLSGLVAEAERWLGGVNDSGVRWPRVLNLDLTLNHNPAAESD